MKNARGGIALSLAVIASLTLAGCTSSAPADSDKKPESSASDPSGATDTPAKETTLGEAEPSGDVVAPGSIIGLGLWGSYDYVGVDDATIILASRLVSVAPTTQAQTDFLIGRLPKVKDYDLWLIHVEQKKVSGDPIAFNSDYTNFRAITAAKTKVQSVGVIGWDECKTVAFTRDFDNDGAVITQCMIAATPRGGDEVAGVEYSRYNSPYSSSGGKPLIFLK